MDSKAFQQAGHPPESTESTAQHDRFSQDVQGCRFNPSTKENREWGEREEAMNEVGKNVRILHLISISCMITKAKMIYIKTTQSLKFLHIKGHN